MCPHQVKRFIILEFMTYRSLLIFVTWCLASCSNEPSKIDNPKASKSDQLQNVQLLDTALSFSGVWVNEAYINKIKVNRSPRLSQSNEKSCIVIPLKTLMVTRMIYGFHEGGGDMMIAKDGNSYYFCDPVSKKIQDSVTVISPTRIKIGDKYFSRLKHQDTTMINLGILEEILFKGRYRMVNGSEVDFFEDGSVKGLDSFRAYLPQIDFTTDATFVDHIQLGLSKEKLHDYVFLFDKDTLYIDKVTCVEYDSASHVCLKEGGGDQVYKLIKLDP
jgi:hypothetical protein